MSLAFLNSLGDIDLDLFDACGGQLLDGSFGVGNGEYIDYVNDEANAVWLVIVSNVDPTCNTYTMTIALEPTANLDNRALAAPSGWDAPVVPRNTGGATFTSVAVTPTLDGNAATTFLNWAILQTGPAAVPGWTCQISVDGEPLAASAVPDPVDPGYVSFLDLGPYTIRGGRHTVRTVGDVSSVVTETNETDNAFERQFVWSPLVASFAVPSTRPQPPAAGTGPIPNSDGFQFTRDAAQAWVVSLADLNPGEDDDLIVYSDYASSTAGFSAVLGSSTLDGNATDFVVGHSTGTPVTVYPAAVRDVSGASPGGPFAMDQVDSRFRNGPFPNGDATFLDQGLAANRLADVYLAHMTSGTTFYVSLLRNSGPSDLLFRIYPPTAGGVHSRADGTGSAPISDQVDELVYTATATGWHPIVVYRDNGSDAATPLLYDLAWNKSDFVAVDPSRLREPEFLGAAPNPVPGRGRFEFVLPAAGRARVTLYDAVGRVVRVLADDAIAAGRQSISGDGRGVNGARLGAGVYWARLEASGRRITKRVALLP